MADKKLLWIDDDDPERYLFETLTLEENGWEVSWVQPIEDPQKTNLFAAAQRLAKDRFDAVLLDQVFPIREPQEETQPIDEKEREQDIWSGCRLLYWLRGRQAPVNAPLSDDAEAIYELTPLKGNRSLPVCVVSAYRHQEAEQAMAQINEQDAVLKIVLKPININELLSFFDGDLRNADV